MKMQEILNKILDQQKYLKEKLATLGFRVESPATLKNKFGNIEKFYIIAWSGFLFKTKIAIELLSGEETKANDLLVAYTKALDANVDGVLFAIIPHLEPEALKTAQEYGINFVEAPDISLASEIIVKKFQELTTSPAEEAAKIGM